jgi:hypothetical protein
MTNVTPIKRINTIPQIQNRMIDTRTQTKFPKREKAKSRMIANEPKFKVTAYDSTERRITHKKTFLTERDAQDFLNYNCIKRGLRYYHKNEKGMLDMELEYSLKKN